MFEQVLHIPEFGIQYGIGNRVILFYLNQEVRAVAIFSRIPNGANKGNPVPGFLSAPADRNSRIEIQCDFRLSLLKIHDVGKGWSRTLPVISGAD